MAAINLSHVSTKVNLSYMPGYTNFPQENISVYTSNIDNYNNNIIPNNNDNNSDNNTNYNDSMNNVNDNNDTLNNNMNNYNENVMDNMIPLEPTNPFNDTNNINNNNQNVRYNYDTNKEGLRDRDYLLYLYPYKAREAKKLAENEINNLDYTDSIIYHEYPDKSALLSIIDKIMSLEKNIEINRDLLEVLFYNEIINKRRSYYNQKNNK